MHVNTKAGLTFASCLRSILRQDPNVIMVGEIRDLETAEIALKAAQTGHLVLSTLHTNDSISAVARLLDLGIPEYLISSSLTGILGQRLVRKLCSCRKYEVPSNEYTERLLAAGWTQVPRGSRGRWDAPTAIKPDTKGASGSTNCSFSIKPSARPCAAGLSRN